MSLFHALVAYSKPSARTRAKRLRVKVKVTDPVVLVYVLCVWWRKVANHGRPTPTAQKQLTSSIDSISLMTCSTDMTVSSLPAASAAVTSLMTPVVDLKTASNSASESTTESSSSDSLEHCNTIRRLAYSIQPIRRSTNVTTTTTTTTIVIIINNIIIINPLPHGDANRHTIFKRKN